MGLRVMKLGRPWLFPHSSSPRNRIQMAASDYCSGWNNASKKVIIGILIPTYRLAVSTTVCDYSQSSYTHITGIPSHQEIRNGKTASWSSRDKR